MFLNEEKAWISYAPTPAPSQMITFAETKQSALSANSKNSREYTVLHKIIACSNFFNPQKNIYRNIFLHKVYFALKTKNTGTKRKITVKTWKIHIGIIWQVDIAEYLSSVAVFIANYKFQQPNKVIKMSCCITNML